MNKSLGNVAYIGLTVLLYLMLGLHEARADEFASQAFQQMAEENWSGALYAAEQSVEKELADFVFWRALMAGDESLSASSIRHFIETHAGWPEQHKMRWRYEVALLREGSDAHEAIQEWFTANPPISGAGKLLYARALLAGGGNTDTAHDLLRDAWVNGDFTADQERNMLRMFPSILDKKLHGERVERLLFEEKYSAAMRMLPLLPSGYQALVRAHQALSSKAKNAPSLLSKVPALLQKESSLLYARLLWRHAKKDAKGSVDLLQAAPEKNLPYPEKWWPLRQYYVRDALDRKNYALALTLLQPHGLTAGADFAEAAWLKGWILLEFKHRAAEAYDVFDTLFRSVQYAVSKSRAAYWAGRAAEAMKEADIARSWYASAAEYPTTFYGQLAYAKLYPGKSLTLYTPNHQYANAYQNFKRSDFAAILNLCMKYGQEVLAATFMRTLAEQVSTPEDIAGMAMFAGEHYGEHLGMKAAKFALQKNLLLRDLAYPVLHYGEQNPEISLAHAIIRQESEFNAGARSPSGALGYMQLMPGTGKEVARKLGLNSKFIDLRHPETNIMLGSRYLSGLIEQFDGSYVFAAAAYNAGPGRVRDWTQQYGRPGKTVEHVVNWIEKIPYAETRNYVQRVLENLQIYRAILAEKKAASLSIEQDMLR